MSASMPTREQIQAAARNLNQAIADLYNGSDTRNKEELRNKVSHAAGSVIALFNNPEAQRRLQDDPLTARREDRQTLQTAHQAQASMQILQVLNRALQTGTAPQEEKENRGSAAGPASGARAASAAHSGSSPGNHWNPLQDQPIKGVSAKDSFSFDGLINNTRR